MASNNELSLENTLKILKTEKERVEANNTDNTLYETLEKIDNLIQKAESLVGQNLEDKVLIGSLVDLELVYSDGEVERSNYYLGVDLTGETITILSPLGNSIFGATVGETISYEVKSSHLAALGSAMRVSATIHSKNNFLTVDKDKTYEKTTM